MPEAGAEARIDAPPAAPALDALALTHSTDTGTGATASGHAWALALRIVAVAVAVGVSLWLLVTLQQILLQVLLAIILASGLSPLVGLLQQAGLPRAASVLLIYLALIGLLVLLGVAVIPPVVVQIEEAVANAPTYGDQLLQRLRDLRTTFPFLPPLDEQLQGQLRGLGSQVGALASQALTLARFAMGVFSGLLNTLLVLLLTLYLVVDGVHVRDYFLSFVAPARRPYLRQVTDRMGRRMGGWLIGELALMATIGVLSFVGLTVLGVRGALLLAVVAAIGEAIPIVGPILSAVPAVIVAFTQAPFLALLTAGLYLIIQQMENNLLVPRVMQRAVDLHPLAVILSLLGGSALLGVLGAIVSVPVAAAISVALDEVRLEVARRNRDPQTEEAALHDATRTPPEATIPAPAEGATATPR